MFYCLLFLQEQGAGCVLCSDRGAVRQQYQEFRKWFSGQKVDYLVGPETDDKADVEVMIEFNEVRKILPVLNPNSVVLSSAVK